MNNDSPTILDQVQAKAALQAILTAAGQDNVQAMEREQTASQLHARLSFQLREVRDRIERDRSNGTGGDDAEALAEREAALDRALAAAEADREAAATASAAARQTIKAGMSDLHRPIKLDKGSVAGHLEAIAAAVAEVERIDDAIHRHEQDSAARRDARAAAGARYQEDLSRFLAGQALGEIPVDATFEPPPVAPDDASAAASATLAGLASRRDAAVANLEQLQAPLPAIRAAILLADLEAVRREHTGAALKEQRLRTRANALRAILEPYAVHKPAFLTVPSEQPASTEVNQERDRLASVWPDLWATA